MIVELDEQQIKQLRPRRRWVVIVVAGAAIFLLGGGSAAVVARYGRPFVASPFVATSNVPDLLADSATLRKRAVKAEKEIERVAPKGKYVVIDTYRNLLHVVEDNKVIRTAICSTGTGNVVVDPRNGRQWVFDSPLGERKVKGKTDHPIWNKPDWAFIEEGELPPKDPNERIDDISLGEFALYLGDGYIIHGTLFKTLLGTRATHGCIRLGDEDLEFVYKYVPVGTRVYIY